ncbi:GTP-binding protein Era [Desulfonatronum zhilinae]|nr:GTP-binding protein Era [Desulfonatronum zhilinae]
MSHQDASLAHDLTKEKQAHDIDTFRTGWTALLGPPNSGKSTLLNAMLGQKVSIVSPKPQTTRNQVTGILTRDDLQVVFLDTPGLHRLRGKMNAFLLKAAWQALSRADMAVIVLDGALYTSRPHLFSEELQPLHGSRVRLPQPLLVAVNKIDKVKDRKRLLPLMEQVAGTWPEAEIIPLSAATGENVESLITSIAKSLPPGPPLFPEDQLSTVPLRFMASEIIREKLFLNLHEELPYRTAVDIENWDDTSKPGLTRIHAVIFVERDSHKAMVIGKQGRNLKQIGQNARLELEELLGTQVYLELWVKIRSRWSEDERFLLSLGFGSAPDGEIMEGLGRF